MFSIPHVCGGEPVSASARERQGPVPTRHEEAARSAL